MSGRRGRSARVVVAALLPVSLSLGGAACVPRTGPATRVVVKEDRRTGAESDDGAGAVDANRALPEGRTALLAEADRASAAGPAGPDLSRAYVASSRLLSERPDDAEAGWRAARALYLRTFQESDDESVVDLAKRCAGLAVASEKAEPSAQAAYYVALCHGARVQVRQTDGITLLDDIIKAAKRAAKRDPSIHYAGPDRVLGAIYLRAPAWPASVGDLDAAFEHLERAVELAPEWPENHLLLAEAYLADGRGDEAKAALERARKLSEAPFCAGWREVWAPQRKRLEREIGAGGS